MKNILLVLFLLLILSIVSVVVYHYFPLTKFEANEVHVRFSNKTGWDLKRIHFGRRMHENNSFRSKSFVNIFEDIDKNAITEYRSTYGKHLGYSGLSINQKASAKSASASTNYFKDQLKKNGAYVDSIYHVYHKKNITGLNLPKGKYTFEIRLHDTEHTTVIYTDIIRDE